MVRQARSGPGLAIPGRSYARNSDAQIFDAIKHGIPGTVMPAHAGKLSDDQIWKITAYVKGLRGTAIDAPSPGDVAAWRGGVLGQGRMRLLPHGQRARQRHRSRP